MKLISLTAALAATLAFAQTADAREHHRHGLHREARHHAHRYAERTQNRWAPQAYAWSPWGDNPWARRAQAAMLWNSDRWSRQANAASAWTSDRRSGRAHASAAWAENRWARQPRTYPTAGLYGYAASGSYSGGGGRPAAWCGWQMRQLVGSDPGPEYNLARNWTHWGHAGPPGIGAVVVWAHHVGKIVGQVNGQWLIQSGNDGNALRTRARPIAGAIAIRWG